MPEARCPRTPTIPAPEPLSPRPPPRADAVPSGSHLGAAPAPASPPPFPLSSAGLCPVAASGTWGGKPSAFRFPVLTALGSGGGGGGRPASGRARAVATMSPVLPPPGSCPPDRAPKPAGPQLGEGDATPLSADEPPRPTGPCRGLPSLWTRKVPWEQSPRPHQGREGGIRQPEGEPQGCVSGSPGPPPTHQSCFPRGRRVPGQQALPGGQSLTLSPRPTAASPGWAAGPDLPCCLDPLMTSQKNATTRLGPQRVPGQSLPEP